MPNARQHYRRTADQLRHLLAHETAPSWMSQDERDWAELLRERFYELANRGRSRPPASHG